MCFIPMKVSPPPDCSEPCAVAKDLKRKVLLLDWAEGFKQIWQVSGQAAIALQGMMNLAKLPAKGKNLGSLEVS